MGRLIDGQWVETSIITSDKEGAYDRLPRTFRDTISPDHPTFKVESNRYHLYVSYACPWAHRCLIYRELKSLHDHISVSVVHPDMLEKGWTFNKNFPAATGDTIYGFNFLYEIYQKASPKISTSVTVPILWDKKTQTIVNNESSEIIRIFNTSFNELTGNTSNFYPDEFASEIDQLNELIYPTINNGVYRTGFAKSQKAYDSSFNELFKGLDQIDDHLNGKDFLVENRLTEADIRLVTTLLRFDLVYYVHFKCNLKKISEYTNLSKYLKSLYAVDAIKKTTNFDHIKRHYYYSHEDLNPHRIVPLGPKSLSFITFE